MRDLIVTENISLDGVIDGKDGDATRLEGGELLGLDAPREHYRGRYRLLQR